jgi:hypothetical protein
MKFGSMYMLETKGQSIVTMLVMKQFMWKNVENITKLKINELLIKHTLGRSQFLILKMGNLVMYDEFKKLGNFFFSRIAMGPLIANEDVFHFFKKRTTTAYFHKLGIIF